LRANIAESIYTRLKNLAKKRQQPMGEILRYYCMERFLYRLGISDYNKRCFIKGGLLLMIWNQSAHRATYDIDMLVHLSNDPDSLSKIVKEVCALENDFNDGVVFNCESLSIKESQPIAEYSGLSVRFKAILFSAKVPMKVDFGFSDIILPNAIEIHYPALLEFPAPTLKGYTIESVIGEKLEAIFKLGQANTRLKDFYDIWTLFSQFEIDPQILKQVVVSIFTHRKNNISKCSPQILFKDLESNPNTLRNWSSFLNNIGEDFIPFETIIRCIKDKTAHCFL
jgi:predicted nucleotidyltransferase component of viral defense system